MSAVLNLYHRTSVESAQAILASRRFITRESTPDVYVSNRVKGHATGYGDAVVHVRVPHRLAVVDDEFSDGEKHYRVPLDQTEIVGVFTLDESGGRRPLRVADAESDSVPG